MSNSLEILKFIFDLYPHILTEENLSENLDDCRNLELISFLFKRHNKLSFSTICSPLDLIRLHHLISVEAYQVDMEMLENVYSNYCREQDVNNYDIDLYFYLKHVKAFKGLLHRNLKENNKTISVKIHF